MDHLNPSITPAIGLSEYSSRQRSGTTSLEKPTGERYKPNCTMNGTIKRKSRYLTIKAAIHRPAPNDASNASSTNRGSRRTLEAGTKRYQAISRTRNTKDIRKSTKLVMILL